MNKRYIVSFKTVFFLQSNLKTQGQMSKISISKGIIHVTKACHFSGLWGIIGFCYKVHVIFQIYWNYLGNLKVGDKYIRKRVRIFNNQTICVSKIMYKKKKILATEAIIRKCSVKRVLLIISQNSQENTCTRVSFLMKL